MGEDTELTSEPSRLGAGDHHAAFAWLDDLEPHLADRAAPPHPGVLDPLIAGGIHEKVGSKAGHAPVEFGLLDGHGPQAGCREDVHGTGVDESPGASVPGTGRRVVEKSSAPGPTFIRRGA